MVTGAGFGLAIGSALGSLIGAPGLWMSLCMCLGTLGGMIYDNLQTDKSVD